MNNNKFDLNQIPFNEIMENIPPNFLTSINLSGNQIEGGLENINNMISLLTCLKYINFSKNNIKYFPSVLLELPCLEELNLSRNSLTNFPSDNINQINISNITQSLLILDLSNNKIDYFPLIIGLFKNLKILI